MLKKNKKWWSNRKFKKIHERTKKISKKIVDEQIFDANTHIAEFILPILEQYRYHMPVKHEYMTEYEFIEAIDNMIYAFENYADIRQFSSNTDFNRIKKGLQQFAENFCYFGW